jgi:hypothetical protein
MGTGKERHRKGFLSWFLSVMRSLAGIATAFATIATAVAAVLGLRVHEQATQLQQIRVIVKQQASQIQQLRRQPSAQGGPAASAGGTSLPGAGRYLSDTSPVNDYGLLQTGQQVIVNKQYPKSLAFDCDGGNGALPDEVYDVSGSTTFTAEAGIPDHMSNTTGVIATVTFTDQSGQPVGSPVPVSLGRPVKVTLSMTNVTQLGMTCVGRDAHSGQTASDFQVALGDARVF